MIDRESVFQLVNNKAWPKIIAAFKINENYSFISNDVLLKPFIDEHFINELLNAPLNNEPAYKNYLLDFYMLHTGVQYKFELSIDNFRKLVLKIVEFEQELAKAYDYALLFPNEGICKQIIQEFEAKKPSIVSHSQEAELFVTENKYISESDSSTSIFKSKQEYHFYKAVREVFPTFLVFPNVALSAIINFANIKTALKPEERTYFFKALVDCVVIDAENNYKPTKFIELDSPFHDTEEQIEKDKMKDRILAVAGQKLTRIRRLSHKFDEQDFTKLIRESLR